MKKRVYLLAALIVVSAAFLFVPVASVVGQASETRIINLDPESGFAATVFNVTLQGTINTTNGNFLISLNDGNNNFLTHLVNSTASGNSVTANFAMPSLIPGNYRIVLVDVNSTASNAKDFHIAAEGLAAIPIATGLIMLIAIAISFANVSLNRLIITKMIGWHEYRTMQKEIAEHNAERMAALRAKDTKAIERLKKKDSQVNAMQAKMLKPQMLQFPLMFIYFFIWPFLTGFFPFTVAYIPGLGAQPFFAWYILCSFFFATVASRIVGITQTQ